jgi:hypothetical protein
MKLWILVLALSGLLVACDRGVDRSTSANEGKAAQSAAGGSANEGKAARSAAGGR